MFFESSPVQSGPVHVLQHAISNRSSEIASEFRNVITKFPAHLSISEYNSELERVKFAETDCKNCCCFDKINACMMWMKDIINASKVIYSVLFSS